ncbi:Lrp/AsnC family transcriptional regulator [Marinomonas sp. 5E14-1]|uniref:Lrp/AsnC family transcriptional regulator n=1 Tax=Marinomonas sp. 5E14-1 TaxID=3153922 RepID=UPI003264A055
MDALDKKILEQLQIDAKASMSSIAEKVGLSEPACYRRVRQLRSSGVIEKEMAIVKPKTMGWPLSMLVMITFERDHNAIINSFLARVNKEPEVLDSWCVTGDHDVVLQVLSTDMEAFDDFANRVLHKDDSVKYFRTLVVLKHSKANSPVPPAG